MRELHFQRGPLNFNMGPQPWEQGPSYADASEYSMPYLPFFFSVCTYVAFLCIFTNLELQERYLSIIRGAGTPLPCVPGNFNQWMRPSVADVAWCVWLSAGHNRVPYKNGWADRCVVWGMCSSGSTEPCIRWRPGSPHKRGTFVRSYLGMTRLAQVDILNVIR